MSADSLVLTERHEHEVAHGRRIAGAAEDVWGWSLPTGPARLGRRAAFLSRSAALRPGRRVLEIGCGTGRITEDLAKTGAEIVAIDLSHDLLERARRRRLGRRVRFEPGNAERLAFADGRFDAVVGSSVLHHLDLGRALTEIRRVLRPSGRIAFSEPNMLNPHILLQKNIPLLKRLAGDSPDETAFVRWPFRRRLERAGFADVAVTPYDFLHPAVPRAFIPFVQATGSWIERVPVVREVAGSLFISAAAA